MENQPGGLICFQEPLQCRNQVGSSAGFVDKAIGAQESNGRFGLGRGLLHGEKQNLRRRRDTPNLEGGLYPVHHRHIDIEKDQFRVERLYLIEGLLAIGSFTADAQSVRIQQLAHGAARDTMIVDKKDSGRKSPAYACSSLSPRPFYTGLPV
jgi:hypothetical protein